MLKRNYKMKSTKIVYWIATAIVAIMMSFSAYFYLAKPESKMAFEHLGFPGYFRIELAIAKVIGAVLLLIPVSRRIKEWVYSSFALVFVSAFIAHTASGDPVNARVMPVVFLALLITSYVTYQKVQIGLPGTSATNAYHSAMS